LIIKELRYFEPAGYWNNGILESWSEKKKNKRFVVSDFDIHYSTIPTIHHSNSSKDFAY
jgi:hypothetical protein